MLKKPLKKYVMKKSSVHAIIIFYHFLLETTSRNYNKIGAQKTVIFMLMSLKYEFSLVD